MTHLHKVAIGLLSFAFSQGSLFLLQSYYVALGQFDAVTSLAQYFGFLALASYAFDGNSGLVFAMLGREGHASSALRGFVMYRAIIFAGMALLCIGLWGAGAKEMAPLSTWILAGLILRFPLVDGFLDQRQLHHIALALNYAWMPTLAVGCIVSEGVESNVVGASFVVGSLVMLAGHLTLRSAYSGQSINNRSSAGAVLSTIFTFMMLGGIGQIYGRATMFAIGTLFSGPLAALVLYAKQVFNITGALVNYARRLELSTPVNSSEPQRLTLRDLRYSAAVQGAAVAAGTVGSLVAGTHAGLPLYLVVAVIVWQTLEKASGNLTYLYQLMGAPRLALISLIIVCAIGSVGLAVGRTSGKLELYLLAEGIAFILTTSAWLAFFQNYRRADRAKTTAVFQP